MPELPEVETIMRGLEPVMTGAKIMRVILRRSNLRYPFPKNFIENIGGQTIQALARRAKYMLIYLSSKNVIICHLGMSGKFLIEKTERYQTINSNNHEHVVFQLSNGFTIGYRDPRRFGFMDLEDINNLNKNNHLKRLGIEPLEVQLTGKELLKLFHEKRVSLKTALLDQRLIAGLGNIYVCEALYRSSLHPERKAMSLSQYEADKLVQSIKAVLQDALHAGGSTLKDYSQADGSSGYFQHTFQVYNRENEKCYTSGCDGHVVRIVQNGRSTFFCSHCQTIS